MVESTVNEKNFEARARALKQANEQEERERSYAEKSPFRNFVQLNRKKIVHIIKACHENKHAVRLLFFIIEHMDGYNALICPYAMFKKHLGMSQATVARSIKYLKDKGFIDAKRQINGNINKYIVNEDLVWKNSAGMLGRCKYSGKPLQAADENEVSADARVKICRIIDDTADVRPEPSQAQKTDAGSCE